MNEVYKKIIIIGGGGHARVLLDILNLDSYPVIGYTDLTQQDKIQAEYLGDDNYIHQYKTDEIYLVNGIGSAWRPQKRRKIFEKFKSSGYRFNSVIHPKSIISPQAELGEGIHVIGGVVINAGAIIEENVIINTSSSVDHDCEVGAHTHIAPGVSISGGVKIGQGCLIGTGAKIIQGISIGDNVLVGAGEVIRKDIPSNTVYCHGKNVEPLKAFLRNRMK